MGRPTRATLSDAQRALLEKWSRGGSTPYRVVVRSRIILLSAEGLSNRRIARRLRINPITVARWKSRFRVLGVDGLLLEAPRLGSPPRIPRDLVRRIVDATVYGRPTSGSRWSTRSLARAVGVSHSTVRRVWKAYDVHPPRSQRMSVPEDPRFVPRFLDVIGLYVNPPHRAIALSVRRATPGSPVRSGAVAAPPEASVRAPGRAWTVPLMNTLTMLEGRTPPSSPPRYHAQELLTFLDLVGRSRRGRERVVLLTQPADDRAVARLDRWVQRHPEFSVHPSAGSDPLPRMLTEWLGTTPSLRTATPLPESLPGLRSAVERWMREASGERRPFAWTRE